MKWFVTHLLNLSIYVGNLSFSQSLSQSISQSVCLAVSQYNVSIHLSQLLCLSVYLSIHPSNGIT